MRDHHYSPLTKTPKNIAALILGAGAFCSVIIITIVSIPVYIFRLLAIKLAKIFRSDLDKILDPASSAFVNDYFTHADTPRSNCVLALNFQGHVTASEVKATVMKNWINARDEITGDLLYERLQHYPERWLGFTFWKNGSNKFNIDNHVKTLAGKNVSVTDDKLTEIIQAQVNRPWEKEQSPWIFYVIEDFKFPNSLNHHSIVIFNMHHSLSDGYGMMTAFVEGFFSHGSMDKVKLPNAVRVKRSALQKIWFLLSLPVNAFLEYAHILSHIFTSSPWKVPNEQKKWRQVVARPDPISIQDIKCIKNKFGVGFTSVLISAVSAATHKSLEMSKNLEKTDSMICVSALPITGTTKRKEISNNFTAAIFDIPTSDFGGPVERLRCVDRVLQKNKGSTVPLVFQYFTMVLGAHFYFVCELLIKNRFVPMGLSNMAGMPEKLILNGKQVSFMCNTAGGLQGDTGMAISVISYEEEIRISAVAEEALMSKEEANQFASFITHEINLLREMAKADKFDRNANGDMIKLS